MNIRNRYGKSPKLETGALNDILFILLMFFLIVSTLANPNVIKVSNPKASSDTRAKQTVVVSIDQNENLYVGQKAVTLDQLPVALQESLQKEGDKPTVVINGDSTSHLGMSIRIMQIAKSLGASTVMAVSRPEGNR